MVCFSNNWLRNRGFTLIEILTVIALLALLASLTIIAINPSKQLSDSRDAERESHVFTITQSVYQFAADSDGVFPSSISSTMGEICLTGASDCSGLVDLSVLTNNEAYLINVPSDPLCGIELGVCATNGTGYFIGLTTNGRLQVTASSSENRTILVAQ